MKRSPFVTLLALTLVGGSVFSRAESKKLTLDDARKAALAVENGQVKSEELEREKGRQIYSFDIAMPDGLHEVNIDAVTGKLVEDTVESAKAEAAEAAEDAKQAKKKARKAGAAGQKPQ